MIRKVELAIIGFNFFGTIEEGSSPSGSTREKTALLIHFENKFQNFICCLFFLFLRPNENRIKWAPEKCPHFLGKGINKRMVRLLTIGKS